MNHELLDRIELDPWLAVRLGKVRYFYRGQRVLWKTQYCGDIECRVIQPEIMKPDDQWNWVTHHLELPQPPSYCLVAVEDSRFEENASVSVDELEYV